MSEKYYILKLDKIEPHNFLRFPALKKDLFIIDHTNKDNTNSVSIRSIKQGFYCDIQKDCLEKAPPELVVAARLRGEI